ncbi:heat shock 70 kDa protein 12A-like [Crassostrea virginica]
MRKAGNKAGINDEDLIIALEPEAASLYCMRQLCEPKSENFTAFKPRSKYMLVDAGGGTVDIIVHEVQDDGTLRELHKANGGDWGGTSVDVSFMRFLASILGDDVLHEFTSDEKGDTLTLMNDFEFKKRKICSKDINQGKKQDTNQDTKYVIIRIPASLKELYCKKHPSKANKKEFMLSTPSGQQVKWFRDKMIFEEKLIKCLFDDSCKKIIDHMHQLFELSSLRDVSSILLVGGFAESPVLQEAIIGAFQHKKVIIPEDAGLAVLKGAVLYGHKPNTITERVSRHTYGVSTNRPFDRTIHPQSKKVVYNGIEKCKDCFDIHVRMDASLKIGQLQEKRAYTVCEPDQTEITFPIFCSKIKEPTFTTEPGCHNLGKLTLAMPDISKGMDRGANVYMTFGGTEIKVTAVDEHDPNKTVSATIDFLG